MCDVEEVIKSSYQSAGNIVSTLYDYGEESFGGGVRKLADEMFATGARINYESGYNEGFSIGLAQGESKGVLEGSLITTGVFVLVGISVWSVKKIIKKYHKKTESPNLDNTVYEEV